MIDTEKFAIFSPMLGVRKDIPTILLSQAMTSDAKDVIFKDGYVKKAKKRSLISDYAFPDQIMWMEYFIKHTTGEWWFLIFTKRDIAYRDIENDRYVFINKQYDTGSVDVTKDSKTVSGNGTSWNSEAKAGDFIALKNGETEVSSDLTWYEIESVESDTSLTLKENYTGDTATEEDYFIRKILAGTNHTPWSTAEFKEQIAMTNSVDDILIWAGIDQVSSLDCPYKCKYLYPYERRLMLGAVIEAGTLYPNRIRWSGIEDETDWGGTSSDAGAMNVYEGMGVQSGFATYRGNLIIIKTNSFVQAWIVTTDLIFNKKLLFDGIGSLAPQSIMETEDAVYFYSGDMTIKKFDGFYPRTISDALDPIMKAINPDMADKIQVTLVEELNMLLWAIPYEETDKLNRIIGLDLDDPENVWTIWDMEVAALGYYEVEEDMDWSDLPYENWMDWDWESWISPRAREAFPVDVAGGYDGKISRINSTYTDFGENYSSYFVLRTDLSEQLGVGLYKRLLSMRNYFKNYAGDLTIELMKDTRTGKSSYTLNQSSLDDREITIRDLPVDVRAKSHAIKISGDYRFEYLGALFEFITTGDR